MFDTTPGGRYRVGGRLVDANGEDLKGGTATDPAQNGGGTSDSGDDYPYKELLAAGGIMDSDAARTANYEELIAVDGIGPAKAREIINHFGNG